MSQVKGVTAAGSGHGARRRSKHPGTTRTGRRPGAGAALPRSREAASPRHEGGSRRHTPGSPKPSECERGKGLAPGQCRRWKEEAARQKSLSSSKGPRLLPVARHRGPERWAPRRQGPRPCTGPSRTRRGWQGTRARVLWVRDPGVARLSSAAATRPGRHWPDSVPHSCGSQVSLAPGLTGQPRWEGSRGPRAVPRPARDPLSVPRPH